jgi:hypothetical protein
MPVPVPLATVVEWDWRKLAVVTDGRFSGFARGLGVCQVSRSRGGRPSFAQNGIWYPSAFQTVQARSVRAEWKKKDKWQPPR